MAPRSLRRAEPVDNVSISLEIPQVMPKHLDVDFDDTGRKDTGDRPFIDYDCIDAYRQPKSYAATYLVEGPKMITFFVRTFNGKSITFEMPANAKVDELNREIQEKTGIYGNQYRLSYQGRPLQDGHTLDSYDVKDNSTIEMMGRCRGG